MSRSSKWLFSLLVMVLAASFGLAALAQTTTTTETKEFEVVSVDGNKVVAKTADGVTKEYTVPAGFMFKVDGKDVGVADLHAGQKGTAVVTNKVTTTPVTVTEIREGEVVKASGGNVIVRGPKGLQSFTQGKADKRGIQIYKDGKLAKISDLRAGDKISATIVTSMPPKIVSERSVKASMQAPAPTAAPAMAAAPAPAPEPAPPAPAPVAEAKPKKLPKTASPLPLLALLGSLSAASGLGMTAVRRLRARA